MGFLDQFVFSGAPPTRTNTDLGIQKSFPGMVLAALEVPSNYATIREVNGALWLVVNADWNGTGWYPIVATQNAYAQVLNYTTGSAYTLLTATGTALAPIPTPIVWTVTTINLPPNSVTSSSLSPASQLTQIGWFSAKDYGATGNGSTNDAADIQAALNACGAAGGGITWLGPGNFLCGTTQLTIPTKVHLVGEGPTGSVLQFSAGVGTAITYALAGVDQWVTQLGITLASGANTDNAFHIEQSSRGYVGYVYVANVGGNMFDLGNDLNANATVGGFLFEDVKGTCLSTGSCFVLHKGGSGWTGVNSVITGSWNSGSSGVIPSNTSYGLAGLTAVATLDTIQLVNVNLSGFGSNWYFGPGTITIDMYATNCVNDYSYYDALNINVTGGGTWGNNNIVNCWFKSTYGNDVTFGGGIGDGVINSNLFVQCLFPNAGISGVNITGSRVRGNRFFQCNITSPGIQGSATAAAIYVGPSAGSDSATSPNIFDTCIMSAATGPALYGVYFSAGAVGVTIKDGVVTTFTNPFYFADGINVSNARRIRVQNSVGFGGSGTSAIFGPVVAGVTANYGTLVSPVFAASNTPLLNPFPTDADVYISGGTVTSVLIGNSVSTSTVATGLTSGLFKVPYGCYIKATYTGAPTLLWNLV